MVLRLIEENKPLDEVIFFDTGMEFECIYHNRDLIRDMLREKGIRYTELSATTGFIYDMLVRPVKYRNPDGKPYPVHYGYGWCGGSCRWGTRNKTSIIKKHYITAYGEEEIFEYVGIAADEPARALNDAHKLYPLIEWNMTESDCLKYCYEHGYDWNEGGVELYSVLDRVSCWCCQNKNLKELKNIYLYLPKYWQMLRGLQSRLSEPMKGSGKSVFDLELRFQKEAEIKSEMMSD